MGVVNSGFSAIGRLAAVVLLAVAFFFGLAGVVYMSLQGKEVQVPDITGKDFTQSENELAQLGLKIKKRADRFSTEKPNTVIEQLPKPGETVKTGQMILVVTSKSSGSSEETQPAMKKTSEEDDSEKIEDMISDKPKKSKANSNTNKKKADTSRDTLSNTAGSNTSSGNSNRKETPSNSNSTDKPNKNTQTPSKPKTNGGDMRQRVTPKPQ